MSGVAVMRFPPSSLREAVSQGCREDFAYIRCGGDARSPVGPSFLFSCRVL